MKKTRFLIWVSLVLCMTLLFSACQTDPNKGKETSGESGLEEESNIPDNPENNKAVIITKWNSAIKGESNGSDTDNEQVDISEIYNEILSQAFEMTLSADIDGQKGDLYLGMKDGVMCQKNDASEGYLFYTDDLKLVSVFESNGELYSEVIDYLSVLSAFGMTSGNDDNDDAFMLSDIDLPEMTDDAITIAEDGKYVISNEYIIDFVTEIVMFAQGVEQGGGSSVADASQKNAIKAAIKTYADALDLNVYLTAKSEKITGMGISFGAEGADADEIFGLEKLNASMSFEISKKSLLTGFDLSFEYQQKGAENSCVNTVKMAIEYDDDGKLSKMLADAVINIEQITMSSTGLESYDNGYVGTVVKGDLSLKFNAVIDLGKINEKNGEIMNVSLKTVIGNMKAYKSYIADGQSYDTLDKDSTNMVKDTEYYLNLSGKMTAVDEKNISAEFTANTNLGGEESQVKLTGDVKVGSADSFPKIPANVIAEKDKAIEEYKTYGSVKGDYIGQY